MMADLAILSGETPRPARQAGLQHRFRYWRGASGKRYLFSVVPAEALADFRAVVVMQAEPMADGRLICRSVCAVESNADMVALPRGMVALVHFLAPTELERRRIVNDLSYSRPTLRLAA